MKLLRRPNRKVTRVELFFALLKETRASQIVEFAVTLPLLVVFVVAIGDFGGAITLKHKLNNAVREGARFAANEPTSDLYSTLAAGQAPPSVNAVANLVGHYLQSAKVNDCGLASNSWTISQSGPVAWQYTASSCALTLTIDRGFPVPAGSQAGTPKWLVSSQVTISYPYQWQFNRVIGLLVSGANYAGPSQLTSNATVPNLI